MINISVRQKRLLKIWAKNFVLAVLFGTAMFATVAGFGIGLIMLGKIYGPGAIFGTMIATFMLTFAGVLSYGFAKDKLAKIELEEKRTMDMLKLEPKDILDKSSKYRTLIHDLTFGVKK